MKVPLLDLERIHAPIQQALIAAFERVLHSNAYIMGEEVSRFETACAEYLKVKHAIGVSSGTDALLLALMALDIGPGDEVICPTYTFFATAGCVSRLGATPVFVDIEANGFNLDVDQVREKITSRTKAIIPVHLFGLSSDLEPLLQLGQAHGIPVIEDAAQAIGATYQNQKVGTLGDFGCFSFFPAKNLGAFGDGGLLVTQDDALAEKAKILRVHGSKPKYYHHYVGGNFRLDSLQAALLGVKLPYCDQYAAQRGDNAARYHQAFSELPLRLPFVPSFGNHVYNQYVIQMESTAAANTLKEALKQKDIGFAVYYPVPLHLQPCFASLGNTVGDLPRSELAAETTLALPIFPGLTDNEQNAVIQCVQEAL